MPRIKDWNATTWQINKLLFVFSARWDVHIFFFVCRCQISVWRRRAERKKKMQTHESASWFCVCECALYQLLCINHDREKRQWIDFLWEEEWDCVLYLLIVTKLNFQIKCYDVCVMMVYLNLLSEKHTHIHSKDDTSLIFTKLRHTRNLMYFPRFLSNNH